MAEPSSLKPLFLLNDEPIRGHEDNFFAPDLFATTVARAALGTKGPFTIGVYGDWGTGKTSVLHAAKSMIDRDPAWSHVLTVEFNAWRYEREEHVIIPLVATIEKAIEEKLEEQKSIGENARAIAVRVFKEIQKAAKAFISSISLKLKTKMVLPSGAEVGAEIGIEPREAIGRAENSPRRSEERNLTPYEEARNAALYLSAFEHLGALLTSEEGLAGADVMRFPRVVVFIDDLDRCQADKAFELLENIKLALSQPGFIFVLALNERVVRTYLDHLATARYGEKNIAIHKSYLDKIIQLPLHMPRRGEGFTKFAEKLLDHRLSAVQGSVSKKKIKKLAAVFALSANGTPRSLVRRINTTLIDIALRDPIALPTPLKTERYPFPIFSGLCIVQRTLEAAIGAELTCELAKEQELCQRIHDKNIFEAMRLVNAVRVKSPNDSTESELKIEPQQAERWHIILQEIYDAAFLWQESVNAHDKEIAGTSILTSSHGIRWLTHRDERLAVMKITVLRSEETLSAVDLEQKNPPGITPTVPLGVVTLQQKTLIERKMRQALQLPVNAPLTTPRRFQIKTLDFSAEPLTDEGVAILASPNMVLSSLTSLNLARTSLTDVGLRQLARPDTALKALAELNLNETNTTDLGLTEIARPGTGLKTLTSLMLSGTKVTDVGLKEIARPDTGLKALAFLQIIYARITDVGVAELACADTGLKSLAFLILTLDNVTDAGIHELARPDTGLKGLKMLNISMSRVTDVGLKILTNAETGLRALEELDLTGTDLTDSALYEIARSDSGLKTLEKLHLGMHTRVTPTGIKALKAARPSLDVIMHGPLIRDGVAGHWDEIMTPKNPATHPEVAASGGFELVVS